MHSSSAYKKYWRYNMEFPKQIKDIVYKLLQEPTLDNFRDFLHNQTGEHNSIDFKEQWIEKASLAKEMLAIANSQGGVIVFGVAENDDGTVRLDGLNELKDPAVISREIGEYISTNLKYDVYDFSYEESEYKALAGKKYQMLVIEDTPQYLPFFAKRESGSLKKNMVYVRRGTSCEIISEEELLKLIERRMKYLHPNTGKPLELDEHLKQLKTLYGQLEKTHIVYEGGIFASSALSLIGKTLTDRLIQGNPKEVKNDSYPDEDYEDFVLKMIEAKKKKIERVLELY